MSLLEELSRPYRGIQTHPIHVLHSELYLVELLADCFSRHWESLNEDAPASTGGRTTDAGSRAGSTNSEEDKGRTSTSLLDSHNDQKRRASRNQLSNRGNSPKPLPNDLVARLFEAFKLFLRPISESYVLPAANILDDVLKGLPTGELYNAGGSNVMGSQLNGTEVSKFLLEQAEIIEVHVRTIVEYISFSNWSKVIEYLKAALKQASHQSVSNAPVSTNPVSEEDKSALINIRLISSLWVDSRKLSIIIQEICGTFLHLRKAFQTTVAIVLPLLITRWLERNPDELIELHSTHKRLDGGAETLFDMTNTMADGGRRKALLFPFQTSLLFLLPDVFEVASNMREVKSSSLAKKVSFLETLRKSLRNRNETAIYCLTSVLRVARHFPISNDSALPSYALDVQEEVREAVFRLPTPGMDAINIDSSLMTAAFVSLTHLNFEYCVDNLTPLCLSPNSPQDFQIAAISACAHFARQSNAHEYRPLFVQVAEFVRVQLKVR